jgi:hypothetical protein
MTQSFKLAFGPQVHRANLPLSLLQKDLESSEEQEDPQPPLGLLVPGSGGPVPVPGPAVGQVLQPHRLDHGRLPRESLHGDGVAEDLEGHDAETGPPDVKDAPHLGRVEKKPG